MNILKPEFYQRISELHDSLMDYIKENGPYSLDYYLPKIQEITETKMKEIGTTKVENTNGTTVIVNLYLEDDWDTSFQITLNFYAKIKNLFTPLLKVNLQEFRDNLKTSLIPILPKSDQEEYTDRQIEEEINQVLYKATMWIKSNEYQLEWYRESKSLTVHLSDESVQISLNIF